MAENFGIFPKQIFLCLLLLLQFHSYPQTRKISKWEAACKWAACLVLFFWFKSCQLKIFQGLHYIQWLAEMGCNLLTRSPLFPTHLLGSSSQAGNIEIWPGHHLLPIPFLAFQTIVRQFNLRHSQTIDCQRVTLGTCDLAFKTFDPVDEDTITNTKV